MQLVLQAELGELKWQYFHVVYKVRAVTTLQALRDSTFLTMLKPLILLLFIK